MPKIEIVSGPVIIENGRVLLDQHGDDNFWKFCGGKLKNLEEGLWQGAQRRAKEEMGVKIARLEDNPFLMFIKNDDKDVILAHFLAKRIGKIVPGENIRAWDWFALRDLPDNLAPNIQPVLAHFNFI